jgi:RHS repeat-associated protein
MDAVTYDDDANAHTYATTRYTTPLNRAFSQQNTPCASSEYTYDHAVVRYYGYRYYSPNLGRWISRDPLGEIGGENIYGFVGNNGILQVDVLGLSWFPHWGLHFGLHQLIDQAIEWVIEQVLHGIGDAYIDPLVADREGPTTCPNGQYLYLHDRHEVEVHRFVRVSYVEREMWVSHTRHDTYKCCCQNISPSDLDPAGLMESHSQSPETLVGVYSGLNAYEGTKTRTRDWFNPLYFVCN